ncbi:MAG: diphosphomevalonate decarboxylase [Bacteroidota bacterium]
MFDNPALRLTEANTSTGTINWKSPSNLAIIKYWGKYGRQYPQNPSISFTLENAFTQTILSYQPKENPSDGIDLAFTFHGEENEAFRSKMVKFLESILPIFPFLDQLKLTVQSGNSFPHSAGIASSASSMSALALCLCSLEDELFQTLQDDELFDKKASYVARLGSGSACRSIYSGMAAWGTTTAISKASNDYAVPFLHEMHDVYKNFHDDILIASKGEKSVSSRAGHALMEGNAYAQPRYEQANRRMEQLVAVLKNGDVETFGEIAENEALTLHALMMTSEPSYILMRPNSLKMIELIRQYRQDTKHPIYFSLDAGPNLHVLYPESVIHEVRPFIEEKLVPLCEEGSWISDWVGEGPEQLDV